MALYRIFVAVCSTWLVCVVGVGAQVVQLPTFHVFSLHTTVSVPDRGSVYLGSVDRAAMAMASRGVPGLGRLPVVGRPFNQHGIVGTASSTGAQVTATIIDRQKWDAAILQVTAESAPLDSDLARHADFLTRHIARHEHRPRQQDLLTSPDSVIEIRRRNQRAAVAYRREAARFYEKARQLESEGKSGVAKIYYGMVACRAAGELKERSLAAIARLQTSASR